MFNWSTADEIVENTCLFVCLIAENDIVENTSLAGLVILPCLPYSGCAFNCPDPTLDDDDDLVMTMLMIGCQCHPVDILASIFWVKYFSYYENLITILL